MKIAIPILLIWLTVFSAISCISSRQPQVVTVPPAEQMPPWPSLPVERSVVFAGAPGGLFLAAEEYRKLEANIIEMRRYIGELEAQLKYYRGEPLD